MTRKLTSILAETRTGKKYNLDKDVSSFENEATSILKNTD